MINPPLPRMASSHASKRGISSQLRNPVLRTPEIDGWELLDSVTAIGVCVGVGVAAAASVERLVRIPKVPRMTSPQPRRASSSASKD